MREKHTRKNLRSGEGNDGAPQKGLGPTEGSHRKNKTGARQRAILEDTMERSFPPIPLRGGDKRQARGLFDAVESITENPAFCEWMYKFCEDCPAITYIPATHYTPGEVLCPCDFQPFVHDWCERRDEITDIEKAAETLDNLMRGAVAL